MSLLYVGLTYRRRYQFAACTKLKLCYTHLKITSFARYVDEFWCQTFRLNYMYHTWCVCSISFWNLEVNKGKLYPTSIGGGDVAGATTATAATTSAVDVCVVDFVCFKLCLYLVKNGWCVVSSTRTIMFKTDMFFPFFLKSVRSMCHLFHHHCTHETHSGTNGM